MFNLFGKKVSPEIKEQSLISTCITECMLQNLSQQLSTGTITTCDFHNFLEHRNPFVASSHQYVTFSVKGSGRTGLEWLSYLEIGDSINQEMIDALTKSDYDLCHRLTLGKEYIIGLIPTNEIREHSRRSVANYTRIAMEHFGGHPEICRKAELILLLKNKFTESEIKAMGVQSIRSVEPINLFNRWQVMLSRSRDTEEIRHQYTNLNWPEFDDGDPIGPDPTPFDDDGAVPFIIDKL